MIANGTTGAFCGSTDGTKTCACERESEFRVLELFWGRKGATDRGQQKDYVRR